MSREVRTCEAHTEMGLCVFGFVFSCVTTVITLLHLKPFQFVMGVLIGNSTFSFGDT